MPGAVPTDGPYDRVASGWGIPGFGPLSVCGLDSRGRIDCGSSVLFAGAGYQHVSVALAEVVAIDAGGELLLGTGSTPPLDELPTGSFIDVDLGTDYGGDITTGNWGCAVRTNGHLECFGRTLPSPAHAARHARLNRSARNVARRFELSPTPIAGFESLPLRRIVKERPAWKTAGRFGRSRLTASCAAESSHRLPNVAE